MKSAQDAAQNISRSHPVCDSSNTFCHALACIYIYYIALSDRGYLTIAGGIPLQNFMKNELHCLPTRGINNVFSSQFQILGLSKTWITPDKLFFFFQLLFYVLKPVPVYTPVV